MRSGNLRSDVRSGSHVVLAVNRLASDSSRREGHPNRPTPHLSRSPPVPARRVESKSKHPGRRSADRTRVRSENMGRARLPLCPSKSAYRNPIALVGRIQDRTPLRDFLNLGHCPSAEASWMFRRPADSVCLRRRPRQAPLCSVLVRPRHPRRRRFERSSWHRRPHTRESRTVSGTAQRASAWC